MNVFRKSAATAALLAAVALAWWWQNRAPATPAASGTTAADIDASAARDMPAVEVGRVEAMRLEDDAQAVGTLRSRQGVMLRPEVSGRIARLAFNDGQRVRRDQLLVQLDDSLQRAQLQQAQAQASIARTNLQRNQELLAQNFISQSAVDQSRSNLEVAQAQVALAQAQLARMRIVAPFDGVVGIRVVNVGDYVKDGADLVNIEDLSSVWVDFRLPERFVARLKPGQGVQVTLDALPGRRYLGRIDALDSQLDANGRSVLVRAKLANARGELRAGMYARSRVVFDVRERALVVPEEALVPLGDKQYVYVVVHDERGALARRIEARVGQRVPGKVELLGGVKPGDTVVVAGQSRLGRGDEARVRVVDLATPAANDAHAPPARAPLAAASGAVRTNPSAL